VINDIDIYLLIQLIWHSIKIAHYLHKDFFDFIILLFLSNHIYHIQTLSMNFMNRPRI